MGVVDANLVEILVEKLKSEIDEIKDIILDTLHFCMIVTTAQALRTDAMKVFVDLLQHEDNVIRSKAARNINDLRFYSYFAIHIKTVEISVERCSSVAASAGKARTRLSKTRQCRDSLAFSLTPLPQFAPAQPVLSCRTSSSTLVHFGSMETACQESSLSALRSRLAASTRRSSAARSGSSSSSLTTPAARRGPTHSRRSRCCQKRPRAERNSSTTLIG